ncbi:winged helix DNA-binding domain-containing protein [Actinomycetes bacterium KLBMP 9797]
MMTMGAAERRARLAVRHGLAAPAEDATEAARRMVALHATDPASVFLAVRARTPNVTVADIEDALYERRSLMRMLGMRRTMFVVPVEVAPVVEAACTKAIAVKQRRLYTKILAEAGVGDEAWFADVEDGAEKALIRLGQATGAQLSAAEPRLRTQILAAEGKAYERTQNITTWVLFMLAADGRIVRGRPRGTWASSQWSWSPVADWLPGGMPQLAEADARVELARRWLAAFGPATAADLRWWTGWTAGQTKQALTALAPVEVDLDGAAGLVLADDLAPTPAPEPWVALLPALDPTAMGWAGRSWYVGAHSPTLFDRSGNIGPTVWSDGRIVGGWAQRGDGEIGYRLLEDIGSEKADAVAAAAHGLSAWIGDVRVTPRFRTPLERELAS